MSLVAAMKNCNKIKRFKKWINENIYLKKLAKIFILIIIINLHLGNKYIKVLVNLGMNLFGKLSMKSINLKFHKMMS